MEGDGHSVMKVLFQHLPGGTEQNNVNPSGWPMFYHLPVQDKTLLLIRPSSWGFCFKKHRIPEIRGHGCGVEPRFTTLLSARKLTSFDRGIYPKYA